jgi:methylenetetrahydrofolate dehydrogenase (NADP+) / methenyltetrahydrofolate cyclohydrolase
LPSNVCTINKSARILDGRAVAASWQDELALEVTDIKSRGGRPPGLGVILVGDRPDSLLYVSRKQEACKQIGMHSVVRHLSSSISQVALRRAVLAMCADPSVDGVLVQLPLPGHIDEEDIIEHFDPGKDVDGFHPLNVGRTLMRGRSARFVPCTALGCVELLRRSNVEIHGKSVAIVGDSNIVGMPLAMLFRDEGAATVTVVHRSSYSSLFSGGALAESRTAEALGETKTMVQKESIGEEISASDIDDTARRRAEAKACLPHTPGPVYSSNQAQESPHHHREVQPYQVTYSSGMRDAYLPPTFSNFEDPAAVPSHLAELAGMTRTADILVVAVGYPHLVKEDWIKPGAVVIDVGINVVDWDYHPPQRLTESSPSASPAAAAHILENLPAEAEIEAAELMKVGGEDLNDMNQYQHISSDNAINDSMTTTTSDEEHAQFHVVGDVDFHQAMRVASALTPVPGGVGPMTIAALLHNTVRAAAVKMGLRKESDGSSEKSNSGAAE